MTRLTTRGLFEYGGFALPLAWLAIPVYVYVPELYASRYGLSLALLGALLMLARLLDAFIDPSLGQLLDRQQTPARHARLITYALPLLAIGFPMLLLPPNEVGHWIWLWLFSALLLTYLGYSLASIVHQSWGAALTQAQAWRTRITGTREVCAIVGVLLAAGLAGSIGLPAMVAIFLPALALFAWRLLRHAPQPPERPRASSVSLLYPLQHRDFRQLLATFMVSGIAAALPATLFLFFVQDVLQSKALSGVFLLLYFTAGAASIPLWVRLAQHYGEGCAWLAGMLLAVLAFSGAYFLQAGDSIAFVLICIFSGGALGADLSLPPALLAALIRHHHDQAQREGAYFGLWNWATKMNLALAAGIALPLLELLGYQPASADPNALHSLSLAYAVLPCLLKLLAAAMLWRMIALSTPKEVHHELA